MEDKFFIIIEIGFKLKNDLFLEEMMVSKLMNLQTKMFLGSQLPVLHQLFRSHIRFRGNHSGNSSSKVSHLNVFGFDLFVSNIMYFCVSSNFGNLYFIFYSRQYLALLIFIQYTAGFEPLTLLS